MLAACTTTAPVKPSPQFDEKAKLNTDSVLSQFLKQNNLVVNRKSNETLDEYISRRIGVIYDLGLSDKLLEASKAFDRQQLANTTAIPKSTEQNKENHAEDNTPVVSKPSPAVIKQPTNTSTEQQSVEYVLQPIIIEKVGSEIGSVEDIDLQLKTSSSISVDIK